MAIAHNLGFPRIGHKRELKRALEHFWSGQADATALAETAWLLRKLHWELQRDAGLDLIHGGDVGRGTRALRLARWRCRPRHLLRDGARHEHPTRDGDDQVVRHELSLHRARIHAALYVCALEHEAHR